MLLLSNPVIWWFLPLKMIEYWILLSILNHIPANIYRYKINNRNTRKKFEVCSKLTIKTLEWRSWRPSGIFVFNIEHLSHLLVMFLLLLYTGKYMLGLFWSMISEKGAPEIWNDFAKSLEKNKVFWHVCTKILWKPGREYSLSPFPCV